jgi:putative redox protein
MKIVLNRKDDAFLFESANEEGLKVTTDASPDIGGGGAAMRPMQLVLSAVASCSSIDVVLLLNKQRQPLHDLRVTVEAKRKEKEPRVFTDVHVHYLLAGPRDAKKVERACRLSMEKLCSVSLMLKAGGVNLTWSYAVVDALPSV